MTRTVVAVAVAAAALGISAPAAHAQATGGIGVGPTELKVIEALRGTTYEQLVTLSNGQPTVDVEFTIEPGGEIAPWLTVSEVKDGKPGAPTTKFLVPRNSRTQMMVSIAVPATAPNRRYEGKIQAIGQETQVENKQSGSSVGLAIDVAISVDVNGTERREGSLTDARVAGAEVGQAQRFIALVKNSGNIAMKPELSVTIMRGGTKVAEISNKQSIPQVSPARDEEVITEWQTSDQNAGDYTAEFRVADVGGTTPKVIGTKTVPFRLDPRGTLTRSGIFEQLKVLGDPTIGITKTAAVFVNTGKIDTRAVFSGELYRNDKLVKSVTSLEKVVKQGARELVEMNLDTPQDGKYKLVGKMNFEGVETEPRELEFTIGSAGGGGGSSMGLIAGVAAGVVVLAALGFVFMRRRNRPMPKTERMRERERLGV
jgi:hypothetical protein